VTGAPASIALCAGVVAHNERARVAPAIRSLLEQQLPQGAYWTELTVVVSGSTDGTEEVVRELVARDPRIRLVVQPAREGKSSALAIVFDRARGDYLLLLNGDARASPGAVAALLRVAASPGETFAVMGRPVPPTGPVGSFASAVTLLWSIHHSFHQAVLASRTGNHLSDELLLLPVRHLPPLGPGIVNDGSFLGGWLVQNEGELRYAPGALVRISSPRTFREHVRQRRRIVYGHRQIRERLSLDPTTIERHARSHPRMALRLVAAETRRPGGVRDLLTLLAAEAIAHGLAEFDRHFGQADHVRWRTILGGAPEPGRAGLSAEGA
jgi:glycosyltransferase involved in cell wall biosynthesis